MSEQTVIFTTQNVTEAHMVRGVLESNGIQATILDDNMIRLNPLITHALGGVRIMVRSEDFLRAEKVLQKHLNKSTKAPFSGSSSPFSGSGSKENSVEKESMSETISDANTRSGWGALIVIIVFLACISFISSSVPARFWQNTVGRMLTYFSPKKAPPPERFKLDHVSANLRGEMTQPLETLLKKAQNGDAEAAYALGWKYYFGVGTPEDDHAAIQWIRQAAEKGSWKAQYSLGLFYGHGLGVLKDAREAFRWFEMAANQGDAASQTAVGVMLGLGEGVAKNEVQAVSWLQKAADKGFAPAQDNLGHAYENGRGVPKDLAKAVEFFRKAVNQEDASAYSHLGYCYMQGWGVPQDYREAASLFEKGAKLGNRSAQYNFGTLFENGRGVTKNWVQAYAWFLVAAARGDAPAQKATADWKQRLSASELTEAHELAKHYEDEIYLTTRSASARKL